MKMNQYALKLQTSIINIFDNFHCHLFYSIHVIFFLKNPLFLNLIDNLVLASHLFQYIYIKCLMFLKLGFIFFVKNRKIQMQIE